MKNLSRSEILGITVFSILVVVWIATVAMDMIAYNISKNDSALAADLDADKTPETILVHVAGAVVNPGLIELPYESRVTDAIKTAGGTIENADTSFLNLAENIFDGQKLYVPIKGEKIDSPLITNDESIKAARSTSREVRFPINLNTASKEELTALPGVGDIRAQDIIDYRTRNSGFKKKTEIMSVKGIAEGTYAKIKDLIYI